MPESAERFPGLPYAGTECQDIGLRIVSALERHPRGLRGAARLSTPRRRCGRQGTLCLRTFRPADQAAGTNSPNTAMAVHIRQVDNPFINRRVIADGPWCACLWWLTRLYAMQDILHIRTPSSPLALLSTFSRGGEGREVPLDQRG